MIRLQGSKASLLKLLLKESVKSFSKHEMLFKYDSFFSIKIHELYLIEVLS